MAKRNLFLTAILTILLFSTYYAYTIPNTQALETTVQQKGLSILNYVVNVDTAKYDIKTTGHPQDSYFGAIPQEDVEYTLVSSASNLKLLCTFTNGSLTILHVLETEGSPIMTKSAVNSLETTKDFLKSYQRYTGNTVYGELNSMLDTAISGKNLTVTSGTVKLDIAITEEYTTYSWSYTFNGINAASKCVSIGYKNGFLKYFVDTWNIYKIGSTSVILSEKEAVNIAMEQAKAYSWKVVLGNETYEINNFNVTNAVVKQLVFCNSINAGNPRGDDPLELYPMWRIGIGLDKYYPGNVYGIYVDIWADTKQIRNIQEVFSTLDPPTDKIATIYESSVEKTNQTIINEATSTSSSAIWIPFPILIILVVGIILLLNTKKHAFCLPKKPSFKIVALLVCVFILFSTTASLVSTVNASNIKGSSTIWGSLATPKTSEELSKQYWICQDINSAFYSNGYVSSNYQGSYTLKANALSSIESEEANNPLVATVWFDHGPGNKTTLGPGHVDEWHFMLCDSSTPANPNGYLYDYEIYNKTALGKTKFAFISVCMSAKLDLSWNGSLLGNGTYGYNNGIPIGMPYAWTHGASMSTDGYSNADSGSFCYIGFPSGSAALNQIVDTQYFPNVYYYDWVQSFFSYGLNYDMTINQALDHASYLQFTGHYFGATALHTGFTANWTGCQPPTQENCTLVVYGNGDINLYQPLVHFSAVCDDHNHEGLYTPFTIDGYVDVNSQDRLISKTYTVSVNSLHNYQFDHFTFNGLNYGSSIPLTCDGNLVAHYTWAPVYYNLTVSSTGYGYTIPTGTNSCLSFTTQTATAYPDAGYIHYWIQDDINDPDFAPTKEVLMDEEHTLQAYFVERPEYNFPSYVTLSEGTAYDANRLAGVDNDGRYATLDGWGPYEMYGSIAAQLYFAEGGHIYAYGYGCANGPLYVYASEDGYNWELVSTPTVGDTLGWIDCGIYNGPCNYIKFTAESPNDVYNVYLDSVRVQPLYYQTLSISTDGEGYTSPSGNPVYERNSYAGVTACAAPTWVFDYWTLDGDYAGSNPTIYVYMDYDYNLEAHFSEASSLQYLTVNTYDAYLGYAYSPNVWVDGYWIGTGQQTLQVASGREHTVSVDYTVYSEYWGCDANFIDFTGDVYYYPGYGPAYIYPTSSTTINALYLPYWWT
jgi:hypothetical protein